MKSRIINTIITTEEGITWQNIVVNVKNVGILIHPKGMAISGIVSIIKLTKIQMK